VAKFVQASSIPFDATTFCIRAANLLVFWNLLQGGDAPPKKAFEEKRTDNYIMSVIWLKIEKLAGMSSGVSARRRTGNTRCASPPGGAHETHGEIRAS